jgi:hypothetical protein
MDTGSSKGRALEISSRVKTKPLPRMSMAEVAAEWEAEWEARRGESVQSHFEERLSAAR